MTMMNHGTKADTVVIPAAPLTGKHFQAPYAMSPVGGPTVLS